MPRIRSIDTAKFICLGLMVYGHIPSEQDVFCQIVYSFHMPFFFLVSGLFFSPDRFKLKSGFLSLMLPYFCFNLLVLVLNCLFGYIAIGTISHTEVMRSFLSIIVGSSDNACPFYPMPIGPSWFLLSLFTIKAIGMQLFRLRAAWTWTVVLTLFGAICVLENHFLWFLCSIDSSVIGLLFFTIGYYLRDYILGFLDTKWSQVLFPFFLLGSSFAWVNGWVRLFAGQMGDSSLLFLLFAVIGILMVILLSRYIPLPQKIVDVYNYGAIFLVCMNIWLIEYVMLLYKKFFLNDLYALLCWYERLGVLLVVFAICYPCIRIFARLCPQLLGRRPSSK